MKIALITGSAGDERCGVGEYAYELAQHLALDGEVHLYFDKNHKPLRPPFDRLTTLKLIPVSGYTPFHLPGLVTQIRAEGYDIVHLQYPSKGYGMSPAPGFIPQQLYGMGSRSRVIVTLHEWRTSHPLRKLVMDQMLPSVDALVVTNEGEMQLLVPKLGGRPVMVIPVGNVLRSQHELEAIWLQAEGKAAPALEPPRGPEDRLPLSLFHYGLPAQGKGFSLLLEALKLLRESGCAANLYLGGDFSPSGKLTEELLGKITELDLADAVVRLGHIPRLELERTVERYMLGVFPFEEGFSTKRSSLASISHCDLPLVVGYGSAEEHPYYAPAQNTAESLAVLLSELLESRLNHEWITQVNKQREYSQRFAFGGIAQAHMHLYAKLRRVDV